MQDLRLLGEQFKIASVFIFGVRLSSKNSFLTYDKGTAVL